MQKTSHMKHQATEFDSLKAVKFYCVSVMSWELHMNINEAAKTGIQLHFKL